MKEILKTLLETREGILVIGDSKEIVESSIVKLVDEINCHNNLYILESPLGSGLRGKFPCRNIILTNVHSVRQSMNGPRVNDIDAHLIMSSEREVSDEAIISIGCYTGLADSLLLGLESFSIETALDVLQRKVGQIFGCSDEECLKFLMVKLRYILQTDNKGKIISITDIRRD